MGLELTEICLNLEDRFGITIDEGTDWKVGMTVGDLYCCVLSKIRSHPRSKCRTLGEFLALRRALAEISGRGTSEIRLHTPFDEILPWYSRRSKWRYLRKRIAGLPGLELHPYLGKSLAWGIVAFAAIIVAISFQEMSFSGLERLAVPFQFAFCSLLLSGIIGIPMYIISRPIARSVPADQRTLAAFLATLFPVNSVVPLAITDAPFDEEVWSACVQIVADATGISANTIEPEHRLVEDLRAG